MSAMHGNGEARSDRPASASLDEARELTAQLAELRGTVRRDRRATSLPLLVLGSATALALAPAVVWPGSGWTSGFGSALQSLVIVAAFAVIWLVERRRAVTAGVGSGRGFGAAAIVALVVLIIPGGFIAALIAGPFLTFAIGLLIAGLMQGNKFITWFAVGIGVIGMVNDLHWITNRLPVSVWSPREQPAISLLLALVTVATGLRWRRRESRAA
jgi:hypothetical protein